MSTYIKRDSKKGRILWVVVLLAGTVGAAAYFYLHPESLPDWATKTAIGRELQTTTVYKWQDPSGGWHVSDQPPPEGTKYKTEKYTRDTNVLPLPPAMQQ